MTTTSETIMIYDHDDHIDDYDEDVDVDEAFLTINMMMTASEND